jgi:hypothetical protein
MSQSPPVVSLFASKFFALMALWRIPPSRYFASVFLHSVSLLREFWGQAAESSSFIWAKGTLWWNSLSPFAFVPPHSCCWWLGFFFSQRYQHRWLLTLSPFLQSSLRPFSLAYKLFSCRR